MPDMTPDRFVPNEGTDRELNDEELARFLARLDDEPDTPVRPRRSAGTDGSTAAFRLGRLLP